MKQSLNSVVSRHASSWRFARKAVPQRQFSSSVARRINTTSANDSGSGSGSGNGSGFSSAALSPRWLSDIQARINACGSLNLSAAQRTELDGLKQRLDAQWLELLAGQEGFLSGPGWKGLDRQSVAWGDMDAMGKHFSALRLFASHVNNVVYNKHAETARVEWFQNFTRTAAPEHQQEWAELMTPKSIGLIMKSIKTDYKLPITYPDKVTVLHKLARKPDYDSDAVFFDAIIISEKHRRAAARCFEEIVVYDYQRAARSSLKPFMVDRLRETYDLQQKEQFGAVEKVEGLFNAVAKLEGTG